MMRDDGMREDVSHDEIAVMCDVARSAGTDLDDHKAPLLETLIGKGLVAPASTDAQDRPRYRITPDGQALLDERGVGANES